MPLPYQRMSQVPDGLIRAVSDLREAAFRDAEGGDMMRVIVDIASRMESGERVGIPLANLNFADGDARAMLTLTMDDRSQITWGLELPDGKEA